MANFSPFRIVALSAITWCAIHSQIVQAEPPHANPGMPPEPVRVVSDDQASTAKAQVTTPLYRPPHRQAPAPHIRVGGGTRGPGQTLGAVVALVPEHVGLTAETAPTLYWYVDAHTSQPVEFVLMHEASGALAMELEIPPSVSGIQAVHLGDYGISLNEGEIYTWSVAVIVDRHRRSRDVLATGSVIRVSTEPEQPNVDGRTVSHYAEAGLWYDALNAALSAPATDADTRAVQTALLRQVGLIAVAEVLEAAPLPLGRSHLGRGRP